MTGVVVVAHGDLAPHMLETAMMICGEQHGVSAVGFSEGEGADDLRPKLRLAVEQVSRGDGRALLLVDIPGGTPANVCGEFMLTNGCRVVCGVNVPMLMEVLLSRDGATLGELARTALESGREGLVDLGDLLQGQTS